MEGSVMIEGIAVPIEEDRRHLCRIEEPTVVGEPLLQPFDSLLQGVHAFAERLAELSLKIRGSKRR